MKGIYKLLIIVVLVIFMLPSCGENKDVWEPEINEYMTLYLGDSTGTPDAKSGMVKPIYSEDDFICYAEQSEYSLDFEEIHIILKSTTGEQWFMYCTTPALEYFDDGEWHRLHYVPHAKEIGQDWPLVGSMGSDQVKLAIRKNKVFSTLYTGKYRAIVFVGGTPTKLYAEFDIVSK